MSKAINIVLSTVILLSLTLNTGYYKCNKQSSIHLYTSCCEGLQQEPTCCTSSNKSETNLDEKCCDKVDVEISILTMQDCSSKNVTTKEIALIYELYQCTRLLLISSKRFNKPFKFPIYDRSATYKVHCSFLC